MRRANSLTISSHTESERCSLFGNMQLTDKDGNLIASFYHDVNEPSVEAFINERVNAIICQIDRKQDKISLDVYPLASHFAFDNISRLLYGKSHCSHVIEIDGKERRILAGLKKAQLWGPFQVDFPGLYGLVRGLLSLLNYLPASLHADVDLIRWNYDKVTEIIAGRRGAEDEEHTLLHRLLSAKNPDGTLLSLNYIASELYDNLNAAQVTVAVTLTYTIYHLSENPMWQIKICDEILGLPSEVNGFPSFASINSAPILDAFVREVYRVNPGTGGHPERAVPDGRKMYDRIYIPQGVRLSPASLLQSELSAGKQIQLTTPLGPRDSLNHCSTPGCHRIPLSRRVRPRPLARENPRTSAHARQKPDPIRLRSANLCR